MPSRAAHTKSRSGCLRCKQRRVKCDEGAPCRDCNRRNEFCSLVTDPVYIASFRDGGLPPATGAGASPATSATTPNTTSSGAGASSVSPSLVQATTNRDFSDLSSSRIPLHQLAPYADWAEDLRLMAHWTTTACFEIVKRGAVTNLYCKTGPEVAVSFPAAMHIMLSIAALHLAHLRPHDRPRYISMSSQHQRHAIKLFSTALQNITKENIVAVFLTSALLPVACLGDMSLARHNPDSPATLNDLLSTFSMIRGVRDILWPNWHWLQDPAVQPIIEPIIDRYVLYPPSSATSPLPALLSERLTALRDDFLETRSSYHDGSKEACHFAVLELEKVMRDVVYLPPDSEGVWDMDFRKRRDVDIGVLMKWQTTVSATFVALLKKGHAGALVILAHWVTLTIHLGDKWFLEGYVGTALDLIAKSLPEEDKKWVEWPRDYANGVI